VLACGGTKLLASNNQIEEEIVWNEMDNEEAVFRGATGGGVSEVFPPPDYQADADVPPSYNDSTSKGRGVPDVAANADPNSGYLVTVDGITTVSGGTSAATPMWAALVARINEALGRRVGLMHPTIYAWKGGKAFHAITTGTNGAYAARPGWDACTGWGSPCGEVLLQALQESSGGS
jgi:kumamolisin